MKLTVFPSDHGDCLLLESGARRMLIDGGPGTSFRKKVLPELAKTNQRPIDCVYLSHIDFDHIGGLLDLVDELYAWRVYDYRTKKGAPADAPPSGVRPPEVLKVWHNAFSAMLEENAEPIASALGSTAVILGDLPMNVDAATNQVIRHHRDLATHTGHALQLTNRIGAGQLGIEVNPEYQKGLMCLDGKAKPPALKLGKVKLTLIGPSLQTLEKLRREWNKWLDKNKTQVRKIQKAARDDADELASSAEAFLAPLKAEARTLAQELSTPALDARLNELLAMRADELGLRSKVTPPNLASLMFLAEEGTQSVLLTGDGHAQDILDGLKERGKLDAKGNLHVNVLKVQHHGAEYNMTPDFAKRITADHYVFCGNGYEGNPELIVLQTIVDARPKGKFKFWFNSTPENASYSKHMTEVRKRVEELSKKTKKRMTYQFFDDAFVVPF